MQAKNLIKSYRIIQTGDSHPIFPDFSNYNFSSGDWTFDWDGWLQEVTYGEPTGTIKDPQGQPMNSEQTDLKIVACLELNGRMSFTDIAEKINISPQTAKYHYDRKLVDRGVVEHFDFLVAPYPVEMSAYHEFMLEFADSHSMNRFFSVVRKLFFIAHLSKALRKNTLLVRTRMIDSKVGNMFTFFSEMANVGLLTSYSAVRLNLNSRLQQTISFELFDDVSGWQWDTYKLLLELNKL
jgi:DNA-binding Lrp family transcriptional regulator